MVLGPRPGTLRHGCLILMELRLATRRRPLRVTRRNGCSMCTPLTREE
uniref:Uncharacterized protein n=1 Tax=Arundo donax TaxID=35708 RepID=A0A0A8ZH16_ARUDO